MLSFKVLAGINYETQEIAIFDVNVRDKENGKHEFTMSASIGKLIECSKCGIDECISYFDDCGFEWDKYCSETHPEIDLECANFDDNIKKQLMQEIVDQNYEGKYYKAICDCSCTDYEFENEDGIFNFETVSCGQCLQDYVGHFATMNEYVDWLYTVWREYHLKEISDSLYEAIEYTYLREFRDYEIKPIVEELFS